MKLGILNIRNVAIKFKTGKMLIGWLVTSHEPITNNNHANDQQINKTSFKIRKRMHTAKW